MTRKHPQTGYPMRRRRTILCSPIITLHDPYAPSERTDTTIRLSVLLPQTDAPYPCILVTVANRAGWCQFRRHSVEALRVIIELAPDTEQTLRDCLAQATLEADRIAEDMRLVLQRRNMPQATQIVRGDTGEILARGAEGV